MLLTIGVPTYNRAEYVTRMLRELLAHPESRSVEVVVVDDGGSDGTAAKLADDAAIASRVRILENDVNLGYPRTFARLFDECETEYLMLTADDDRVVAENLPALLDHLHRERPSFVSPQFLRGSAIGRGRVASGPIAPAEFDSCSAHAPGLVYRVEDCRVGLDELEERIASRQVDALVYPQVIVVMHLLLAGARCDWLAVPTVAEGDYRPSGIRDAGGNAYWSVASRWQQLRSYDALLGEYARNDETGVARQMLEAHRMRAFHLMSTAIRMESPELGEAFDEGARRVYGKSALQRLKSLPIARWAAGRRNALRGR